MFGISTQALLGQLLLGLINGSFYALLSLGLAVIFGMLNIINFAHGALYMAGAFCALFLLKVFGLNYWWALLLTPIIVGAAGIVIERTMLQWLTGLDHLYGLLLTFGLAPDHSGRLPKRIRIFWPSLCHSAAADGRAESGLHVSAQLPRMGRLLLSLRLSDDVVCHRTNAARRPTCARPTENPALVRAFGINVPRMITLTYGAGVGLAALAGVLAAPINQVRPLMGADFIIVVFAVVVIGGMGSILGSIVTGFALGLIEGLTKVFYPEASNIVIFVIMAIVLFLKPAGLFGKAT